MKIRPAQHKIKIPENLHSMCQKKIFKVPQQILDVSRSVKKGPRETGEIVGNESITYVLCGEGKPDTPPGRPPDWSHITDIVLNVR